MIKTLDLMLTDSSVDMGAIQFIRVTHPGRGDDVSVCVYCPGVKVCHTFRFILNHKSSDEPRILGGNSGRTLVAIADKGVYAAKANSAIQGTVYLYPETLSTPTALYSRFLMRRDHGCEITLSSANSAAYFY